MSETTAQLGQLVLIWRERAQLLDTRADGYARSDLGAAAGAAQVRADTWRSAADELADHLHVEPVEA